MYASHTLTKGGLSRITGSMAQSKVSPSYEHIKSPLSYHRLYHHVEWFIDKLEKMKDNEKYRLMSACADSAG